MEYVSYGDFARLQMRVARVVSAESIPGKTRIMRGVVDLGDQTRTVIIGGAQYYEPGEMVGRAVVVLANLEPRTVAGIRSEAMLLAADVDDKPFWLEVPDDVPSGSPIL
ncbi:MAG: tRNA-binding protein [Nitrosopumilaceae archaeon]|nr:tRNA-binding protein [Nitrosopumilaceae archaeon]